MRFCDSARPCAGLDCRMEETYMIWIVSAICLIVGSGVAWYVASSRAGLKFTEKISSLESERAASVGIADELRRRSDMAASDFEKLRDKLSESESQRTAAVTRSEEMAKNLKEQKELLEDAKSKLTDTFKSLASEVLSDSNKNFMILAEEKFTTLQKNSRTDLDIRKTAIEELVKPLNQAVADYQKETRELEKKRVADNSAVGEQLKSLASAQTSLQNETARLVNALKSSQVRGRWGEITLRRIAELAGMSKHCDFEEQSSVTTEDGRLRPDMIVKLPAGRQVVVDSKVPLKAYMEALEADNEADRAEALTRHALQTKKHVTDLSRKEYWKQFDGAVEFVVMFIPNDSFLAAATDNDPNLIESALEQSIIIATPATFIALLKAIAFGWRQEVVAESAQKISILGKELAGRLGTMVEHLAGVGKSLNKSVESYNATISSFERRVLPSARKFRELGVEGKKEIENLQPIDQKARQLSMLAPDETEVANE